MDGADIETLHRLAVNQLAPGTNTPAVGSEAIFLFGNLSDTVERAAFMDRAQVGQ